MESVLLKKHPTPDSNSSDPLNIPLLSQYVHNVFNLNPVLSYSPSKIAPSNSTISWDLLFLHHRLKLSISPNHTSLSIYYATQWLPIEALPHTLYQRQRLLSHLLPHTSSTPSLPHILEKLKSITPTSLYPTLSHHLRILSSPFPLTENTTTNQLPHYA